jgi:hypothetical protein
MRFRSPWGFGNLPPYPLAPSGAGFRGLSSVTCCATEHHIARVEQRTIVPDLDDVVAIDADTFAWPSRIMLLVLAATTTFLDETPHQGFPFGGKVELVGLLLANDHLAGARRRLELLTYRAKLGSHTQSKSPAHCCRGFMGFQCSSSQGWLAGWLFDLESRTDGRLNYIDSQFLQTSICLMIRLIACLVIPKTSPMAGWPTPARYALTISALRSRPAATRNVISAIAAAALARRAFMFLERISRRRRERALASSA